MKAVADLAGKGAGLTLGGRYVLPTLALLALLGLGLHLSGWSLKDRARDPGYARTSQHGLFSVALEPEGGRIKPDKVHSWLLTLKTATGTPVEYAAIDISGGMPGHRHGLPTSPQATDYLGKGRYRIDGLKFTMDGWWQVRIAVSAAAGTDTVVFDVVL